MNLIGWLRSELKKHYVKPKLQSYGDIKSVTKFEKNFGNTDPLLILQSEPPLCLEGYCS